MHKILISSASAALLVLCSASAGFAEGAPDEISCSVAGPQTPRDIDMVQGTNPVVFEMAPPSSEMNLCNIHFHRFAEHKSAAFPTLAMEDGKPAGYTCKGSTPAAADNRGPWDHCKGFGPGDTVEVHWVYTTCRGVEPGEGLGGCLSNCLNPQLRVESQVYLLTDNDQPSHAGFALNRETVNFTGSTTGGRFNDETCSNIQVSWSVGTECREISVMDFDTFCGTQMIGDSDHKDHSVRELVTDPALLSAIH